MGKGKVKAAIKKAGGKAKAAVKKAGSKVKEKSKYAILLPFKPTMVAAIKLKGGSVKMSDPIEKVALLFKDMIIDKKPKINYEDYLVDNRINNFGEEEAASAIITLILNFIEKIKKKKEAGETLSKEEQFVLDKAEDATDAVKDAAGSAAKNWFADLWYIWVGILLIVIIAYFRKGK